MAGHLFHPVLSFDESDPEGHVPEDLRKVVLHSLEKDPKERIESGEEFQRLLREVELTIPTSNLREEVDQILEKATGSSPFSHAPGSTQGQLDEQFPPEPTSSPSYEETVAHSGPKQPEEPKPDEPPAPKDAQISPECCVRSSSF